VRCAGGNPAKTPVDHPHEPLTLSFFQRVNAEQWGERSIRPDFRNRATEGDVPGTVPPYPDLSFARLFRFYRWESRTRAHRATKRSAPTRKSCARSRYRRIADFTSPCMPRQQRSSRLFLRSLTLSAPLQQPRCWSCWSRIALSFGLYAGRNFTHASR